MKFTLVKLLVLTILIIILDSCLVLPSPTYYDYNIIDKKNFNVKKPIVDIETLTTSFAMQRHLGTFMRVFIINNSENKVVINKYKVKMISNTIEYDTITLENLQEKTKLKQKLFIAAHDTLKIGISFDYKITPRNKTEKIFIQNYKKDTIKIEIKLDSFVYNYYLISTLSCSDN